MPDSEMIEKVAKAIFMAELPFSGPGTYAPGTDPWAIAQRSTKRQYLAQARAAIEAAKAHILESVTTYDTPMYDDIGMQEVGGGGEWLKVSDLLASLSPSLKEQEEGN